MINAVLQNIEIVFVNTFLLTTCNWGLQVRYNIHKFPRVLSRAGQGRFIRDCHDLPGAV